jgi:UDP-2,3-diacylglucosamine pyrophosphatase LpxH
MGQYSAVIISDLHLGARNARPEDLLRFLDQTRTPRLIINGDLFDRPHLGELGATELHVMRRLREYSQTHDVQWLRGNHDPDEPYFESILGLNTQDRTTVMADAGEYLVCHGHKFDRSLSWPKWLIDSADAIYRFAQDIDPSHQLARFLKRRCKYFVKAVDNLQKRAVEEGQRGGYAGVVLGHSHVATEAVVQGIHYVNGGCWTELPVGFVGVEKGLVRQRFWEPRTCVSFAGSVVDDTPAASAALTPSLPAIAASPTPVPVSVGEVAA